MAGQPSTAIASCLRPDQTLHRSISRAEARRRYPGNRRMTIRQALRPNFHSHLLNTGEKQVSSFMRFRPGRTYDARSGTCADCGVERSCSLIHDSIARTKWQNADSARHCRFRKSQQKRASDLDSIDRWIPKLDVDCVCARSGLRMGMG
jgi:hypothetical protein